MWISPHTSKYPLHAPNGLITQFKTNTLKEALNELVLQVLDKADLKDPLEGLIQPYLGYEFSATRLPIFVSILINLVYFSFHVF
jgi:hypothetical protein